MTPRYPSFFVLVFDWETYDRIMRERCPGHYAAQTDEDGNVNYGPEHPGPNIFTPTDPPHLPTDFRAEDQAPLLPPTDEDFHFDGKFVLIGLYKTLTENLVNFQ